MAPGDFVNAALTAARVGKVKFGLRQRRSLSRLVGFTGTQRRPLHNTGFNSPTASGGMSTISRSPVRLIGPRFSILSTQHTQRFRQQRIGTAAIAIMPGNPVDE